MRLSAVTIGLSLVSTWGIEELCDIEDKAVPLNVKNVLMVDDDANIRMLAQMGMEGTHQWNVTLAQSGPEAIQIAKSESVDVILLDIMMPEMDGIMTLNELKSQTETRNTPIILLTAKVQKHEMDSYRQIGAAGVICKPFDPVTLSAEVLKILEHWHIER